ncbi:light harvesting protein [Emiliania huxleyi CCMP1516]|uniref:Light harvesting protein n=2 Tax=Emiliania huxleyi TaxID=2903 RepID=A0A0D3HY87_EMIH1|nr:light harvesting protein [Emiliania huxleyi CCMP1516]EOD03972.1 light harvesting protein [Emiliania huxleyi CCMP1516]|eukprot:XP_005756401.1 light harvesting protein [Emiliania huxleyi CCMP1516]
MLATASTLSLSYAAPAAPAGASLRHARPAAAPPLMETKADLEALAKDLNPAVGFWDPLALSDYSFWGTSQEATIGFLREAEIKHGRIAMAGFVGYIVHSNDIRWTFDKVAASVPTGLPAPAVWDAIPDIAKWQIILFVGVMESWRENKVVLEAEGQKHYMSGGKPGYFPSFDLLPHPVPFPLFDPFGISKRATEEKKAKGRLAEINNGPPPIGRLAMIGLFGFLSEATVPGSVPFLKGVVPAYTGEVMAPFTQNIFTAPTAL